MNVNKQHELARKAIAYSTDALIRWFLSVAR